jgi:hypothetical protein
VKQQVIGRVLSLVFLAGMTPATVGAEGKAPGPYDRIVARAIRLLPTRPVEVAVIDADEARPDVRTTLRRLDAFIIPGSKVVYLVKQSAVLQGAAKGSQLYEHMLASIIWHEMAHADGAGEGAARRAEEQLWTRFARDGIFDQVTALRYLQALTNRPDDRVPSGDTCTDVPRRHENPPSPWEISSGNLQRCLQ